jgi:hypothetical protein
VRKVKTESPMNLFGGIDRFSDVRGGVRIKFVSEIEKYFRLILSARDPHRAHVVSLGFPALDHGIL